MADHDPTRLPDELRGSRERVRIASINADPARRWRKADVSDDGLADLVESIVRQGLQQPIGVKRFGLRYQLIWGMRRLHAANSVGWREIDAVVYPEELPEEWYDLLELDENAKREELSSDERVAHTLLTAARLKSLKEKSKSEKSYYPVKPKSTMGRGNKGIIQETAEHLRLDQGAVRKRAAKAADVIGEPVDITNDPPAELTRKAGKYRAATKPPRKAKAGGKYVMPDRDAKPGPSLLEALGKVVGFTPAAAKKYMAEHPEEARKITSWASSVRGVLDAVAPAVAAKPEPAARDGALCCTFCGRANHEVEKLITGGGVYICNECVALCVDIIAEHTAEQKAASQSLLKQVQEPEPEDDAAPELEATQEAQTACLEPLSRRLADWMGDRTQASAAKAIGISAPTLCKVLAGKPARGDVLEKILAKLR